MTSKRGLFGWILFDVATQPVATLITTFVFAPYFASRLASSPVEGQSLWGFATGAAGLIIAVLAPLLGAMADASGRRKPWIAAFSLLSITGCLLLWRAAPGVEGAVALAIAGFIMASIGAEFATVFTNAMMPTLVPQERMGRLSGYGWAAGYFGGLVSLAIMLGFVVASPDTGLTLAGIAPFLGLDPASGEGDRASGPFAALWYLLFILPLLLWTPDGRGHGNQGGHVRAGIASLRATLVALPRHRDIMIFLAAQMIYIDGLIALFAFGGIYAAGTFGWTTIEIGIFGILLTITGTIGAAVGGVLDDRLGPKAVVLGSLACLILASVGILATTADRIFFIVDVAPATAGDGLFSSTAERVYVALGLAIGMVAGPLQAASRTLLARLAPPEHMTQFFGLYALSGKVTSFLGPMLVGLMTAWSESQRGGMAVLLVFFVGGAALLTAVRVPVRPSASPSSS
ncbi:MFS transporter [Agaricicola taiwanensis]|nr:MFS transporter [Agaricicola taiwanensis]